MENGKCLVHNKSQQMGDSAKTNTHEEKFKELEK